MELTEQVEQAEQLELELIKAGADRAARAGAGQCQESRAELPSVFLIGRCLLTPETTTYV